MRRLWIAVTLATTSWLGVVTSCSGPPASRSNIFDTDGEPPPDGPGADGNAQDGASKDVDKDVGPGLCDPKATLGAAIAVPGASTGGNDRFGAITSDELSIAWMAKAGEVRYADRAKATDPFTTLNTYKNAGVALGRVGLSGDGLTLVVVETGNVSLAQVTRANRGDQFSGTPDAAPFSQLPPPTLEEAGPSGALFADPVLSDDGTLLYFTVFGLSRVGTFSESYRTSASVPWPKGRVFTQPELVTVSGRFRRPTGISADNRTLFFWDESTAMERAGFRKGVLAGLNTLSFVDIGSEYMGAQPVSVCARLYFDMPGEAGANLQIFYADKK